MVAQRLLSMLAVTSAAAATPFSHTTPHHTGRDNVDGEQDTSSLLWEECGFPESVPIAVPIQCTTLDVPLDYTEPEAGTLNLSLSKVEAVNDPVLGSILLNFGGPGYEAVQTLGLLGSLLLNITGGHHDLIAMDPRGTGQTIPFDCFDSPEERALEQASYAMGLSDSTDVALGNLWANANVLANICGKARADIGSLVGTPFVARDMMRVVDALNEDGLLRFWGFSYGSALGATAAAMFPDRMDRVVLDGVLDIERYYDGFTLDSNQFLVADKAWLAFLDECIAAGDKCGISHVNSTAEDLATTLETVAEGYRTDPVAVDEVVVNYDLVKAIYYITIKSLVNPGHATALFNNLINREDLAAVVEFYQTKMANVDLPIEGVYGTKCGDATPRAASRTDIMPEIEYVLKTSEYFGAILPGIGMICAHWPFEAKERYTGDFGVATPNPILLIGNTYDPATPPDSAYEVSKLFPGSVVLEQKGYGHSSIAQRSECTWKTIREYFVDGIAPDGNVGCEVDVRLFD